MNDHSLGFVTGIQRIPFTRSNICPRMKRASRKSSVIGIFIEVIVSVVIFVLGSYITYLISVRNEIFQRRIDSVKVNKKNLTSLGGIISNGSTSAVAYNLVNANQLSMNEDINQRNESPILLFTILMVIFLLATIIIVILFVYICLSRPVLRRVNHEANDDNNNNNKPGIAIPTHFCYDANTFGPIRLYIILMNRNLTNCLKTVISASTNT